MKSESTLFKLQQPCQPLEESRSSLWRWPQSLRSHSHTVAGNKRSVPKIVLAFRGAVAGLGALLKTLSGNNRIYIAVALMTVAAPLSGVAYRLFDRTETILLADGTEWYYKNLFYFLFEMGPHFSELLILTAVFLLFPSKFARAWFLLIPIALKLSKIFWLGLWVRSNEEFHSVPGIFFLLLGVIVGALWLLGFDYLINLHFHKRARSQAAIIALVDLPGITDEKRLELQRREKQILQSL